MTKGGLVFNSLLFLNMWGALLALLFHHKEFPLMTSLLIFWYLGTFISCVRKIPIGCVADVEIVGNHAATLGAGYTLIVPYFPFLLFFNRYLMALSTRPLGTEIGGKTRVINEESFLYRDDRYAQKRVHMETGPLGMLTFSAFQNLSRVLFDRNHPSHFTMWSLPFVFAFYVLLGISVLSKTSDEHRARAPEKDGEIRVYFQLKEKAIPAFPDFTDYVKRGTERKLQFLTIQGVTYAYHPVSKEGEIARIHAKTGNCFMVMPGEKIGFSVDSRPRVVINMNDVVQYIPSENYTPRYWNVLGFPSEWKTMWPFALLVRRHERWKYVYEHWEEVDAGYDIIAGALTKKQLSQKAGGGLVCF